MTARSSLRPIIVNSGIATAHPPDDLIDYATADKYVFMLFHTPFRALTSDGWKAGQTCQMMIVPPMTRQSHSGINGNGWTNDWIHVQREYLEAPVLESGLPLNEIFSVSNSTFLSRMIADIRRETLLNAPNARDMIVCKLRELVLLTSRYNQIARQMAASPVEYAHYEQLCIVRQKVQDSFSEPWAVQLMAEMACLSPNRFAVLYKKFFGVSPVNDLIDMRLSEAKWLLTQGALTVAEVAERCGFQSLSYFSRLFKARTGQTPKKFRI